MTAWGDVVNKSARGGTDHKEKARVVSTVRRSKVNRRVIAGTKAILPMARRKRKGGKVKFPRKGSRISPSQLKNKESWEMSLKEKKKGKKFSSVPGKSW